MDVFQAIILGIIQGITEWLPVSSSGQLMLSLVDLLDVGPEAAFSLAIILHTGTLLAVVVKYREDILDILRGLSWNDNLTRFIVVSTIVTAVVGIPVYFFLKGLFVYGDATNALVGTLLIFTGVILHISRKAGGRTELESIGYREMVVAGAAQGIAILPGVSRSGTTVAAMLIAGIKQDTALKLSFIMSIPAVLGAVLLDFSGESAVLDFGISEILAGIVFAFIFGYLTMDALLKVAHRIRFDLFCIILGLIAVASFFL
jgi:undecaprenyl-diphosphatase